MQNQVAGNQCTADIAREQTKRRIYTAILGEIVSGTLAPGHRLKGDHLAHTYKVSRTPIREILIALEKDGLVERIRNRGATVISFTPDDLEELYDIRSSLECLAVRRAVPHMPLNGLLELEQRLVAVAGRHGPRWTQRRAELDLDLHRFIVSHSRNRRLVKYHENIILLPQSLRLVGYREDEDKFVRDSAQEHLMIIRALLRRDSQLAERLLAEHIETGKRKMLELFYKRRETCEKLALAVSSEGAVTKSSAKEPRTLLGIKPLVCVVDSMES